MVATGCNTTAPPDARLLPADTVRQSSTAERTRALDVLNGMQRTAFASAVGRLKATTFVKRTTTEALTPAGSLQARRYRVVRVPPSGAPAVLERRTTGSFDAGWLATWAPGDTSKGVVPTWATIVLSDEPPFLARRTRTAFRFGLRPDTLYNRPVQVVVARPDTTTDGHEQTVRYARLVIDRASSELIGATIVRARSSLLFSEDSAATLQLQPQAAGRWVPAEAALAVIVDIPFRSPQRYHTHTTFDLRAP
ncbi:hypothetical protein [Salisaeta longa]|uniref:hypothetical protein n=1 Tax=Salisaeta longa TaxID=503170 RepID=UPI0012FACE65|nr:hypothetical protein [Salisaeta longa]